MRSFYSLVRTQEGSVLYVCTKLEADSFICSKVIRSPKIPKLGQAGYVLYVYTKFEADKVIRDPKIGT